VKHYGEVLKLLHRLLLSGGKIMLKKIDSIEEFTELLNNENSFYLLKHSLTCPISQAAYKEYEKFSNEHENIPTYYLAVQDSRPLSNEIAEQFQIKHESPQAILFADGKPSWNASHWKITNRSLAQAIPVQE
jgi:bacillithiol system protein YtxJ